MMKFPFFQLSTLLFITSLTFTSALAQVGRVGINTLSPQAGFHVVDSSVLFSGAAMLPVNPGPPPVSGEGVKLFWYPGKAAFRSGRTSGAQWDRDSIGNYSIALGNSPVASGTASIAMGSGTRATNVSTVAIGPSNASTGLSSMCYGSACLSSGNFSFAAGFGAIASAPYAISVGNSSNASNQNTLALGNNAMSSGFASIAIGPSVSTGNTSVAIGECTATGSRAVALGYLNESVGLYTTAVGFNTHSEGPYAFSTGYSTNALGMAATSAGYNTISKGEVTYTMGNHTQANGYASLVIGEYNDTIVNSQLTSNSSTPYFIIGNGTSVERSNAMVVRRDGRVGIGTSSPAAQLHVDNDNVLFSGPSAVPMSAGAPPASGPGVRLVWYADKAAFRAGYVNSTQWDESNIGQYSFAAGQSTTASGKGAVAIGEFCVASGSRSVALGNTNVSTGSSSFAGGWLTEASGQAAFAVGFATNATGSEAFACGASTHAIGDYAFASGVSTIAEGDRSSASGSLSIAKGYSSSASGYSCRANGYASFVVGMYNDTVIAPQESHTPETPLFIIGNGNSAGSRSNVMVVQKNGLVGIGTNTPANRLDIRDDGTSDTAQVVLALISNTSNRPVLQFSETSFAGPNEGMSIEYNGSGTTSENKMHIRGTDAVRRFTIMNDGKIGIGTETPNRELTIFDIGNNGDAIIGLEATTGGAKEMILGLTQSTGGIFGTVSSTNLSFRTNNSTRMTITAAGDVGIGTGAPGEKLQVNGNICYTGSISACSDARYKKDILPVTAALDKLAHIGAYYYQWDREHFPDRDFADRRQLGVIAQEVQPILPEVVQTDKEGYLSVDYSRLSVVLLAAVKEQQETITRLEEHARQLTERLEALEQAQATMR